jgi:hypothetical protein
VAVAVAVDVVGSVVGVFLYNSVSCPESH